MLRKLSPRLSSARKVAMTDPDARNEWTVIVDPQDVAGETHTVVAFDFAALGIKVAINCTLGEVIVRIPDEDDLFVNDEAEDEGSGRPNWSDP
jgi:hypothetical protein